MSFPKNRISDGNVIRKKRFPLFRTFIFVAIVAFIWKLAREHTYRPAENIQNASIGSMFDPLDRKIEEALSKPMSYYINNNLMGRLVKPGDSFFSILSDYEISRDKSNEVYKLLKPMGLSSIYPGDSVVIKKNSSGQIDRFSILSKSLCWYDVNWTDSLIRAEKKPVEISTYTCLVNGILQTSLSEQMQECGVSDAITGKFADIFAWDINFFLDPRKGDVFQIVFEKKYAEGKLLGYGDILAARYITNNKMFYAFGFKEADGIMKYYDENGNAVQKQFLKAPLKFSRISSGFTTHRFHPILGIVRPHLGIDYAAPTGTPVSAAADGKVSFAGWKGGFGNMVILTHGGAFETYYGHLNKILVRTGSYVKQSESVGTVGATGMATGPHLDYRMKKGQQFVNPNTISLPSKESITDAQRNEFEKIKTTSMIAFDKRFTEQVGLQILEIKTPETIDVVASQICRN
jgi:murein DD-endopeptidase MepM/ murein hydrolase activator NlpD